MKIKSRRPGVDFVRLDKQQIGIPLLTTEEHLQQFEGQIKPE